MMIQIPLYFHSKPVTIIRGPDRPGTYLIGSDRIFSRRCGGLWWRPARRSRVLFCLKVEHKVRRRCSPFLESAVWPVGNNLGSREWQSVPDIWRSSAEKFGDRVALVDPYHKPPSQLTYNQLEQEILNFSECLRVMGVNPDEKLALFADNSCRWLVADQGIMVIGAVDVVRGTRSSDEELMQIYNHSDSIALVADNPQFLNRIGETSLSRVSLRFVVLLWGDKSCIKNNALKDIPLYDYGEITKLGQESRDALFKSCQGGQLHTFETINPDDVATLMYTSGTSGTPKGVMLTHRNLLHQIATLRDCVLAETGDKFLSMLPSWHAYERANEYYIFTRGVEQIYTNIKNFKEDLRRYQPHFIYSVPTIYEMLYSSICKQIYAGSTARKFVALTLIKISLAYMEAKRVYEGKFLMKNPISPSSFVAMMDWLWARISATLLWPLHNLGEKLVYEKIHSSIGLTKGSISGGGSLPTHIDRFFEVIGVNLQNGYGLTETSPVIAVRQPSCNILGTVGPPLKHTEIKIVGIENRDLLLPDGSKGVIKMKGPQVMKGYYKNASVTKAVLDEDGWFDTGDIGWIAPKHARGRSRECGGMLVIEGRAKDTIVLSTGENVEPTVLEEAAVRSRLIHQIVVVGQDQRRLGALVVPNKDEILAVARKMFNGDETIMELSKEKMMNLLYDEIRTWTSECTFQIGPISVVDEPFTIENGLMTQTMKIRRDKVAERYREQIANLYK